MISDEAANKNRMNISDEYTQDIAVYDPKGLESLNTYVKKACLSNLLRRTDVCVVVPAPPISQLPTALVWPSV